MTACSAGETRQTSQAAVGQEQMLASKTIWRSEDSFFWAGCPHVQRQSDLNLSNGQQTTGPCGPFELGLGAGTQRWLGRRFVLIDTAPHANSKQQLAEQLPIPESVKQRLPLGDWNWLRLPFGMDSHEVTRGQYWECIDDGICSAPSCIPGDDAGTRNDLASYPVTCVTQTQAAAYCAWKSQRLPTDIEWEFAARGLPGMQYSVETGAHCLRNGSEGCPEFGDAELWSAYVWPSNDETSGYPESIPPQPVIWDMPWNYGTVVNQSSHRLADASILPLNTAWHSFLLEFPKTYCNKAIAATNRIPTDAAYCDARSDYAKQHDHIAGIGARYVTTLSFDVNAFGLLDMAGNVSEWTSTHNQWDEYVIRGGTAQGNTGYYGGKHPLKGIQGRLREIYTREAEYRASHVGFRCAKSITASTHKKLIPQ